MTIRRARRARRLAAAAAAICLALVPAASAGAATLEPLSECVPYHPGLADDSYVGFRGTGFTPSGRVIVGWEDEGLFAAQLDATGAFAGALPPPGSLGGAGSFSEKTVGIRAQDETNPAITATASQRFVRWTVKIPDNSRPTRKVKYRFAGFPVGKTLYAHYIFKKKRRSTVKMGKPNAPCGKLTKRSRYIPGKVRYGKWTVYFSNKKKYSKSSVLPIYITITVYKTFKRVSATSAQEAVLP